jgi:hypothetical protein
MQWNAWSDAGKGEGEVTGMGGISDTALIKPTGGIFKGNGRRRQANLLLVSSMSCIGDQFLALLGSASDLGCPGVKGSRGH